jgi:hypothetical protein
MKEAFVSAVVYGIESQFNRSALIELDSMLTSIARVHEIIFVTHISKSEALLEDTHLSGSLTIIEFGSESSESEIRISALARTSGDFIIEWLGDYSTISEIQLQDALNATNSGIDVVEIVPVKSYRSTRLHLRLINTFRPESPLLRDSLARVVSRRALNQILEFSTVPYNLDVRFSDLPLSRDVRISMTSPSSLVPIRKNSGRLFRTLVHDTRFGGMLPILLAGVSATFGLIVALYAAILYFVKGQNPEGWTTLMVVNGLGISSILVLVGLVWMKLEALLRGLDSSTQITSDVTIIGPGKKLK